MPLHFQEHLILFLLPFFKSFLFYVHRLSPFILRQVMLKISTIKSK
nr:MAG TPA: hypothetical protein [Caudoviricetes sp.]